MRKRAFRRGLIDENSPEEQEVGIDPEMLGHIFENLLEDNKEKGAFYTPKEIVHYMCQESLIEYLKTNIPDLKDIQGLERFIKIGDIGDRSNKHNEVVKRAKQIEELLDKVKICDPAIGSGAFPMGMLHEIFKAKLALDLTLDRAKAKKDIIQNSIYGVDIEKGAVDIARLRFWLSLVVDEDEPQPLPNLDFKIMQGNSLLESFEGIDLSNTQMDSTAVKIIEPQYDLFGNLENSQLNLTFNTKLIEGKLSEKINEYFSVNSLDSKNQLKNEINQIVHEHIEDNLKIRENSLFRQIAEAESATKLSAAGTKKLKSLKEQYEKLAQSTKLLHEIQDKNERPYFLWHLYFKDVFEQGGFDIVIGNPPYIQLQSMGKEADKLQQIGYKTFERTGDIYCLFYELGKNITTVRLK